MSIVLQYFVRFYELNRIEVRALYCKTLTFHEIIPYSGVCPVLGDFEFFRKNPYRGFHPYRGVGNFLTARVSASRKAVKKKKRCSSSCKTPLK